VDVDMGGSMLLAENGMETPEMVIMEWEERSDTPERLVIDVKELFVRRTHHSSS
jgi:hypothetical protein